jgi:hypothetical protein
MIVSVSRVQKVLDSKVRLIATYPEFPYEQGPELLSIILLVQQMILKKRGYIFRIENPLSFYSIG